MQCSWARDLAKRLITLQKSVDDVEMIDAKLLDCSLSCVGNLITRILVQSSEFLSLCPSLDILDLLLIPIR